jgi:hypothetical protein
MQPGGAMPGQPPAGQYPQSQPGQYPQGQPTSGQYPQGQPAPTQMPQGQPMPGQYPQYPPQGPAPGRAAPSDGTVETLDAPGPAAPPTAQSESATAPDLAWYKPITADTALEDRSHERFVSGVFNGHTFLNGPIRGTGSEMLAMFHFTSTVGVVAGGYLPNGSFVAGLDFFRYAGLNLPTKKRSFGLTVLIPTLEMRYAFGTNVLYAGSGLTGVRITACPFVIDLRLPNITVWQPIPFDEASKPSISVGATASFGFLF